MTIQACGCGGSVVHTFHVEEKSGSESGVADPTVQVGFKVGLCVVDGLRRPNIDCAVATEQSRLQSRFQL
jgi:hypothetical protein